MPRHHGAAGAGAGASVNAPARAEAAPGVRAPVYVVQGRSRAAVPGDAAAAGAGPLRRC